MHISVIVPAYNAAPTIGACLEGLLAQTVPRDRYEVIVVDDGSQDETREIVAEYAARLIAQPHQGPAAARNQGGEEATGEIVLFTDADCMPDKNWLAEMSGPFDDPEVIGVKGAYRTRQSGIVPRFVQCEYEERYARMQKQQYIDFIDTYSAGYRRQTLLTAGGFDTRYPTASVEDQEFSFRLAERGYKMVFNPRAVVYHRHPETLVAYFKRKLNVGYWKVMVLQQHPSKVLRDSHTPQILKIQIALAFLLISLLVFPPWLPLLAAALFALSVLPFAIKASRQDASVGLVSPVLIFLRALALGLGMLKGGWDFRIASLFRSAN